MSVQPAAPTAPQAAGSGKKQPLDEVMLAMDVVDTLRRGERMLKRELDEEGRQDELKERLRKIYRAQGIEVPDHVIDEGVAALKEQRFVYKPPPESFAVKLARIYVGRRKWRKWVIGAIAVPIIAWIGNYFAFVAPNARLPAELDRAFAQVTEIAKSEQALEKADQLRARANAALVQDRPDDARRDLKSLETLQSALEQEYTIRIVNRWGERTGVWRVPDINTQARNYYIIVEAIGPKGDVLTVPITNEETGKTERVAKWGLRVDKKTYDAVAADKTDDGIIENDRFGRKRRGYLEPTYEMPTKGGAITKW